MLLCHDLPKKLPKLPSPSLPTRWLSFFSSSTHLSSYSQDAPANSLPRKGRQAVRRLLKLLSSSPSSQNAPNSNLSQALNALRTSPQTISSSDAAALVSAVGDPLLSFNFYRFLKSSKPLFRPDSSIFSSLIQTQLHSLSPLPFRIEFYLKEMRKLGLTFSAAEFRSLFAPLFPKSYALARSFLDQVVGALGPDSGVYGQAIEVFVDHGHIGEAIKVSERAKEEVSNPELSFYSSLIRVYGVTGNAKAAMEVFVEMEEGRVLPDERFYRGLLGILCQVGWMKLSWVILEEMTRRTDFRTDEGLGLNLMRGFLKHGMVSEAEFLFREGILKEEASFLAFAEKMVQMRMPLEAFELLKTTGKPQFYAAALIHGCGKMGLIEEAEKIFREVKSSESVKSEALFYAA